MGASEAGLVSHVGIEGGISVPVEVPEGVVAQQRTPSELTPPIARDVRAELSLVVRGTLACRRSPRRAHRGFRGRARARAGTARDRRSHAGGPGPGGLGRAGGCGARVVGPDSFPVTGRVTSVRARSVRTSPCSPRSRLPLATCGGRRGPPLSRAQPPAGTRPDRRLGDRGRGRGRGPCGACRPASVSPRVGRTRPRGSLGCGRVGRAGPCRAAPQRAGTRPGLARGGAIPAGWSPRWTSTPGRVVTLGLASRGCWLPRRPVGRCWCPDGGSGSGSGRRRAGWAEIAVHLTAGGTSDSMTL